jgi:hypothetical protein
MFNAVFNAKRTLLDLTRIYLYQSFIKTAINTAITVKLLTSKVTLLNITCEKLKMPHEKQLDLGNIKSKVNETCYCETCLSKSVTIRLKCGSGTERIHGADAERIWG